MAEPKRDEVSGLAFALFTAKLANSSNIRNVEGIATAAFKQAEAFVGIRQRYEAGKLNVKENVGPKLADFHCPKLPKTHPHNLVSSQQGDLAKVQRIGMWLQKHYDPKTDEDIDGNSRALGRLAVDFAELGWDGPTLRVAAAIFPAYMA